MPRGPKKHSSLDTIRGQNPLLRPIRSVTTRRLEFARTAFSTAKKNLLRINPYVLTYDSPDIIWISTVFPKRKLEDAIIVSSVQGWIDRFVNCIALLDWIEIRLVHTAEQLITDLTTISSSPVDINAVVQELKWAEAASRRRRFLAQSSLAPAIAFVLYELQEFNPEATEAIRESLASNNTTRQLLGEAEACTYKGLSQWNLDLASGILPREIENEYNPMDSPIVLPPSPRHVGNSCHTGDDSSDSDSDSDEEQENSDGANFNSGYGSGTIPGPISPQ